MLDVALEVPLSLLNIGWFLQCNHAGATRVEMLHKTLDGTALTSSITALKDNKNLLPCLFGPQLQLKKLDLQSSLLFLVFLAPQFFVVGVACLPGI